MASGKDFSYLQDALGALVQGVYTPLCIFFRMEDHGVESKQEVMKILTGGMEQLERNFPYLSGHVAVDDSASEVSNIKRPLIKEDILDRLILKDYTNDPDCPSFDILEQANFRSNTIDGQVFTSLTGAPSNFEGDPSNNRQPVFFVQANFIQGGLALAFAGEHSVMDGHGIGQFMSLMSKACHYKGSLDSQVFSEQEISEGNRPRDGIVPLLDTATYKPGPELDYLVEKGEPVAPSLMEQNSSPCRWVYIHFSASSQAKLKTLASIPDNLSSTLTTPYITTNDALSAFIWQATCRARFAHLTSDLKTLTSTFGHAVDARPSLSISPCYSGNLSHHTYTTLSISTILTSSLYSLSTTLRHSLTQPHTIDYAIRSLATHYSLSSPDTRSRTHYGANMDFSRDIYFSSWAKLPCYHLDFNLGLGMPVCVRRPEFIPIGGLMYLMPMNREGGVDAAICLKESELEALRGDEAFMEFGEWIG